MEEDTLESDIKKEGHWSESLFTSQSFLVLCANKNDLGASSVVCGGASNLRLKDNMYFIKRKKWLNEL